MTKRIFFLISGGALVILLITGGCLGMGKYNQFAKTIPPSNEWFFENSDIIAYVEVLEIDKKIIGELPGASALGSIIDIPKQKAKVKFLKILKGSETLTGKISMVKKERGRFSLSKGQKIVLYLKNNFRSYNTVSPFLGQWELASAEADINTKTKGSSGVVIGLLHKVNNEELRVFAFRGRNKAPVLLNDAINKENFIKMNKFDEFDIAEMPLEPGSYTILLEYNGNLYSFSSLIDGYYPYVILQEKKWRGLYFDLDKIPTTNK